MATASIASLAVVVVLILALAGVVAWQYRSNQRLTQRLQEMSKNSGSLRVKPQEQNAMLMRERELKVDEPS